tara:strand:+ start:315 stop:944 length:630 start_codon:yes stop_codon:yes gene_type:complete
MLPLLGCVKSNRSANQIDKKSYINDFELLQENPISDISVRITSPKAIIESANNDIEIFDSSIQILNQNGQDFQVSSANSSLNNLSNLIRVFNNVVISFIDKEDHFIHTDSFYWNLNSSIIDIDNHLMINFDKSKITAAKGIYDINSGLLNIDNSEFNRNVYNSKGKKEYHVQIKSDLAKWINNKNTLVFTSKDKQVETTIEFLTIKLNE